MSCCVPCRTETVYENRKAAAQKESDCQKQLDDSRKQLEEALEKIKVLEAEKAEAAKKPCCPAFKIESVTTVGKEVIVTFDNCTYLKAPMDVVDESLGKAKTDADTAKVDELSKAVEELKSKVEEVASKEGKNTVYDDSALVKRIEALETREDKDTIFDPESLIGRITTLEGKEDKDTVYDDTAIRNLIEALQNKEDKDTIFDPSALEARIATLESKEDKDTVYDDSALAARVKALEDAPAGDKVDTTKFVRKDELVEVQNWAGEVKFKAYPVTSNDFSPEGDHL